MTPREIVEGLINSGPQSIAQIAGRLMEEIPEQKEAYRVAYVEVHGLLQKKKIICHEAGCYQLSALADFEPKEKEKPHAQKLRPGTSIPRQFAHWTIAE